MNASPDASTPVADMNASPDVSPPVADVDRRRSWRFVMAPLAFTVVFWVRALGGPAGPDSILMVVAAVFTVAAAAMVGGRRIGGLAFVIAPFALVLSPSGQELSFSLVAYDSEFWRWHAVAAALTAGAAAVTALAASATPAWPRATVVAVVALVPIGGLATLGVLAARAPVTHADELDAAARAALPVVELLDFEFAGLPDAVAPGATYTAIVRNPTDLPHTFTADQVGVDLYVPAGREAAVRFTAPGAPLVVICTIGDHAELGMVATVPDR